MVGIGPLDQRQPLDLDRARRELDRLAPACQIVGPLAVDLDRGEARRDLQDRADEGRQGLLDRSGAGPLGALRRDLAFAIVGAARLAERAVKR